MLLCSVIDQLSTYYHSIVENLKLSKAIGKTIHSMEILDYDNLETNTFSHCICCIKYVFFLQNLTWSKKVTIFNLDNII